MLNTFRSRLIALMVFLVFVRLVQGYFSVSQLNTYQGFVTASTSVDEVQNRFANVHLLSAELLTEAIEYANATLQKDPERSEAAGKNYRKSSMTCARPTCLIFRKVCPQTCSKT